MSDLHEGLLKRAMRRGRVVPGDLIEMAHIDAVVRQLITTWEAGHRSWEETLALGVLWLATDRDRLFAKLQNIALRQPVADEPVIARSGAKVEPAGSAAGSR